MLTSVCDIIHIILYFCFVASYCPFGLMCRLGSCHINMSTGQNLRKSGDDTKQDNDEEKADINEKPKPGTQLTHQQHVKNIIPKDTIAKLRKNQYPFVCKRHFEVQKDKKNGNAKSTSAPSIPVIQSSNTPSLPPKERKLIIDFRDKV